MADEAKAEQKVEEELDPITSMSIKLDALEKKAKEQEEQMKAVQKLNSELMNTNKRLLATRTEQVVQQVNPEEVAMNVFKQKLGFK